MEMPIPDDWNGEDFCCWSVMWPDSSKWQAILSGLIESPTQGRFWDFSTGNFLELREAFGPAYDYNFDLGGVIVACNDSGIADALQAIATALANQVTVNQEAATAAAGCCGEGGGGAGQHGTAPNPYEPPTDHEGPPPEGFPDWPAYDANRCAVATYIVAQIRLQWSQYRLINLAGILLFDMIPIIVSLTLIPIPGDEIAVIAAMLVTVAAFGSIAIAAVIETIDLHTDELICALYTGGSSGASGAALEAKFNELFDEDNPGALWAFSMKQAFASTVNSGLTDMLVKENPGLSLPEGDCSDCEPELLCFDFEDEEAGLQGWTAAADVGIEAGSCDSMPATGTLSHVGGVMRGTSTSFGGSSYVTFKSPELSRVVEEGDYICIELSAMSAPGSSYTDRAQIVIDGTCIQSGSSGPQNPGSFRFDLTDYIGNTLDRIWYCWIKSGTDEFTMDIESVGVNCPACAE